MAARRVESRRDAGVKWLPADRESRLIEDGINREMEVVELTSEEYFEVGLFCFQPGSFRGIPID